MSGRILLNNLVVKHNVPVRTQYGTAHVIIFYDEKTHESWCWKTHSTAGLNFEKYLYYNIECTDEGDYNISHVNMVEYDRDHDHLTPDSTVDTKSEQPQQDEKPRVNALDILLPDMNLTKEEKYDMIVANKKGGEL